MFQFVAAACQATAAFSADNSEGLEVDTEGYKANKKKCTQKNIRKH